jgi:hypothetical protein
MIANMSKQKKKVQSTSREQEFVCWRQKLGQLDVEPDENTAFRIVLKVRSETCKAA